MAINARVVATAVVALFRVSWPEALLLGAATAPTDAAVVSVLLRASKIAVPSRVIAALEVESGLNDGGAAIGLLGGYGLAWLFRRLDVERSVFPVLAFGAALATFGAAQVFGASGFLAVYLAGVVVGNREHPACLPGTRFFGALGWLAQIAPFLMLGLLVTPHQLPPVIAPALAVSAVLVFVAWPAGVVACLLPFRWPVREAAFVAWAGLRGAVPIFLTIVPLLAGVRTGRVLFDVVFVAVIVSVAVRGWTAAPTARLLRLRGDEPGAER